MRVRYERNVFEYATQYHASDSHKVIVITGPIIIIIKKELFEGSIFVLFIQPSLPSITILTLDLKKKAIPYAMLHVQKTLLQYYYVDLNAEMLNEKYLFRESESSRFFLFLK